MKQQNLPMLIPVTRKLTRSQKQAELEERYKEIIHQRNEDYFYTHLKELGEAINK
jgi:hypothetical protein